MVKFRMCGRVIEILRWRVDYTEEFLTVGENGETQTEYFTNDTEAEAFAARTGGTKTKLEIFQDDEWLDGLEVEDVPDTYARALEFAKMGEQAYKAMINAPTIEEYAIDLDYRLSKIELGL